MHKKAKAICCLKQTNIIAFLLLSGIILVPGFNEKA